MRYLSLFDGMACGHIASQLAEIAVESYDAYEIDKYAALTATHNFPDIVEHGDVFAEDFTKYRGKVDFLIGGSPCTYWSIAQTNNRETEASGLGWELFSQYVRALHEAEPRYFIYENNKSMSKAIRDSIRETFGFEETCINSALISAQNRQRYYWVGKRNEDGTYSKVPVEQPEDRGILLKDVLDGVCREEPESRLAPKLVIPVPVCTTREGKSFAVTATEFKGGNVADTLKHHRRTQIAEPVRVGDMPSNSGHISGAQSKRIYDLSGKAPTLVARPNGGGVDGPLYPIRVGCMPSPDGTLKNSQGMRVYGVDGKSVNQTVQGGGLGAKTGLYAVPLCICDGEPMNIREATKQGFATNQQGDCVDITQPNSKTRRGRSMKDKCNCLTTSPQYGQYVGKLCYATPTEWDKSGRPVKATSGADGKEYTVYPVEEGQITIKGKTYPIKLVDGFYIIRKLTVSECKRLQTVPEWYDFSCVSNTQAYKMLGNGWTCEVIAHLMRACMDCEPLPDYLM